MFNQIIVRTPARSLVNGTTSQNLGRPDIKRTLEQHKIYIETMKKTGVKVRVLFSDKRFPDGNYVEGMAVFTDRCAVVKNPGPKSRKGEIQGMVDILKE